MLKIEYNFAKYVHISPDVLMEMPFYDIMYLKDEYNKEVEKENAEVRRQQEDAGIKPDEMAGDGGNLPPELLKALKSVDADMGSRSKAPQGRFGLDK